MSKSPTLLIVGVEVLTWINGLLLFLILVKGRLEGMWNRYRAFYVYVTYQLVCTWMAVVILADQGLSSDSYRFFYYASTGLTPVLQIWVLLDTIQALVPGTRLMRTVLIFAAALVVPVFWSVMMLETNIFFRIQAATLVYQLALCVLLYLYLMERLDIRFGTNLGGILAGLSLMVGCQTINFIVFFNERIPYALFQFLVPGIYAGALGVLTIALWKFDPVRYVPENGTLNVRMQDGLRLMLRSLILR